MSEFMSGLGEAWAAVAAFVPKLVAFLLILLIGWFVAKAIGRITDRVLERIGFDGWVERGGVKKALARSRYDASDLLSRIVYYIVLLFVLQLAFGVFGPNPISELLQGVIAYLPKVFAAILIIVVGSAIGAAVKEIVEASLGGLPYGRGLAIGAGTAILVIAAFAALDQLEIAPAIVQGLFYALLAIVVGSAVVAIGGGGIPTMRRYWERTADRAEAESPAIVEQARGSQERVEHRARERADQARPAGGDTRGTSEQPVPASQARRNQPPQELR
jgi:hypothetical protein